MAKPRLIYRRKGKFASAAKATSVWSGEKEFKIHRHATKKERKKIIDRARKQLGRLTFDQKISAQLPVTATAPGEGRRYLWWRGEPKILNVPGKKGVTFAIVKWHFQLKPPIKINLSNKAKVIRNLKNGFYPKAFSVFEPGRNYLFRIDTAYSDESGFSRTTAFLKAGKDGLSDGRGFSIGRLLEVETKGRLVRYLNDSFEAFLKGFETYISRKGIIAGQINSLTLEIS